MNVITREQWFVARIGKTVFRNKTSCPCEGCERCYNEGIFIQDDTHASYLSDMEACYSAEGSPLRYFDTKAESLTYEAALHLSDATD